jgi:hypothetical protein
MMYPLFIYFLFLFSRYAENDDSRECIKLTGHGDPSIYSWRGEQMFQAGTHQFALQSTHIWDTWFHCWVYRLLAWAFCVPQSSLRSLVVLRNWAIVFGLTNWSVRVRWVFVSLLGVRVFRFQWAITNEQHRGKLTILLCWYDLDFRIICRQLTWYDCDDGSVEKIPR